MLFRSLEIISFERNMLFRSLEIISFPRNMLFRSLEIISFPRNMLFRSLEISFAILDALGLGSNYFVPSKSFRSNEICYFVPSKYHSPFWMRWDWVATISFPRNHFVRTKYDISFPRNHFVRTKYLISFPRNIIRHLGCMGIG